MLSFGRRLGGLNPAAAPKRLRMTALQLHYSTKAGSIGHTTVNLESAEKGKGAALVQVLPAETLRPNDHIPLIALIGRPNVGKSSIFNAVTHGRSAEGRGGKRKGSRQGALVYAEAGTTRDRAYGEGSIEKHSFRIVDTGGIAKGPGLQSSISKEASSHEANSDTALAQAMKAVKEADAIAVVVDVTENITDADRGLVRQLKRSTESWKHRLSVIVNKCDNVERMNRADKFVRLSLGDPFPVSASHRIGLEDAILGILDKYDEWVKIENAKLAKENKKATRYLAALSEKDSSVCSGDQENIHDGKDNEWEQYAQDVAEVTATHSPTVDDNSIKIAIVGRPNVGKSSMLNTITGEERAIVSDVAGTTRDPVDQRVLWRGSTVLNLIDTAGIRKRAFNQTPNLETLSVIWALNSIDRCEVAILMIDAKEGVKAQDKKIASHILKRYAGVIVVVNKWDGRRANSDERLYQKHVRIELDFLRYVPVVFSSAHTGFNVTELLDLAVSIAEDRKRAFPTREIMRWFHPKALKGKTPRDGRRKVRVKFATQIQSSVPTFVCFVNHPNLCSSNFSRFLENTIRSHHHFVGCPIRILFRQAKKNLQRMPRRRRVK